MSLSGTSDASGRTDGLTDGWRVRVRWLVVETSFSRKQQKGGAKAVVSG